MLTKLVLLGILAASGARAGWSSFEIWSTEEEQLSNPNAGCYNDGSTTFGLSIQNNGDTSCNDLDFQDGRWYNNYYGFATGNHVDMFSMSGGACNNNYDFYSIDGSNDYAVYRAGGDGRQLGTCNWAQGPQCEIPSPCVSFFGFRALQCNFDSDCGDDFP